MPAMDIGRVCLKTKGREQGERCVVLEVIDRNFVIVVGPNVKRRRVNMNHIRPLDEAVTLQRNASDEDAIAALG
ncbi:50S ribosomal protein L14e [Candidatus Bathyarchaeota archaeon]|nr:50S ribosomal protein L14e [Candidatus Bathyarchaeota archaeon]MBT4320160.1 50S ribosomal protein L14e [Candidatus Bathyarchaeota archaeon]MBT4424786.1 50S ribosomal protein L14e [Candidatus Bathyarchaeota archaeon]MBT5641606.1 50S ribosomal protein L14e [Candidatus Bathyarchaeota archaeon]MBT6604767.1 50S ribosomal protein L14e [Candidatus Bathyarchaeota archaeon]